MYALYQPASPLRRYIECYWLVDICLPESQPLQELIFVDGKADLIFNYGDAYQRQPFAQLPHDTRITHSNVDTPRNYPVQIQQVGQIQLVGVRFRPGGLSAFTRIPAHEAANQILDIRSFFGNAIAQLEAQLYDTSGNAAAQLALLNHFFMQHLQDVASFQYADFAAKMIDAHAGQIDLKILARETGYSTRSLNRFFNQHFGFSLKFYARIARFQAAQTHLKGRLSLTEIALETGFYDQSHFTREFMAFTGIAPGQYRAIFTQPRETLPPNLVHFLQDSTA